MDWSGCDLVEVIEGKVSGKPIVVGTRIPADVIVSNFDAGSPLEEIAENYPGVSLESIKRLLAYAEAKRMRRAS
jgi:uncharacterized protein (DUF433 family)